MDKNKIYFYKYIRYKNKYIQLEGGSIFSNSAKKIKGAIDKAKDNLDNLSPTAKAAALAAATVVTGAIGVATLPVIAPAAAAAAAAGLGTAAAGLGTAAAGLGTTAAAGLSVEGATLAATVAVPTGAKLVTAAKKVMDISKKVKNIVSDKLKKIFEMYDSFDNDTKNAINLMVLQIYLDLPKFNTTYSENINNTLKNPKIEFIKDTLEGLNTPLVKMGTIVLLDSYKDTFLKMVQNNQIFENLVSKFKQYEIKRLCDIMSFLNTKENKIEKFDSTNIEMNTIKTILVDMKIFNDMENSKLTNKLSYFFKLAINNAILQKNGNCGKTYTENDFFNEFKRLE